MAMEAPIYVESLADDVLAAAAAALNDSLDRAERRAKDLATY